MSLAIALTIAGTAAASPRTRTEGFPCAGCVTSWSSGSDPAPVLVLLHGDWGGSAATLQAAWEPFAAQRGVTILSLSCPRDEGCTSGSFWRWNGPPAWIDRQLDALAGRRAIDRSRLWIAGWSGGATYIGFRSVELEARFAAFVIHGGGAPPSGSLCASQTSAVYFLVGERNPLRSLQVELRDYYGACGQEPIWTSLPGLDHEGEWAALGTHGNAIMDFLFLHPRSEASSDAGTLASVDASPLDASPLDASTPPRSTSEAALSSRPSRSGCACTAGAASETTFFGAGALALVAVAPFVRRLKSRVSRSAVRAPEARSRRARRRPRGKACRR